MYQSLHKQIFCIFAFHHKPVHLTFKYLLFYLSEALGNRELSTNLATSLDCHLAKAGYLLNTKPQSLAQRKQ